MNFAMCFEVFSYHIVPGTNNVFLLHFSLTLCLLIFFLKKQAHVNM